MVRLVLCAAPFFAVVGKICATFWGGGICFVAGTKKMASFLPMYVCLLPFYMFIGPHLVLQASSCIKPQIRSESNVHAVFER